MFLEFTNTKISNNPKLTTLIPFVDFHAHMMTLKPCSSQPICSSNSLKYSNYGKAPYIVSYYPGKPSGLYLQVNIPPWLEKNFRFTVFTLLENAFCETPPTLA